MDAKHHAKAKINGNKELEGLLGPRETVCCGPIEELGTSWQK